MLRLVEEHYRIELDPMHREFLLHSDGWTDLNGLEILSCSEMIESELLALGRRNLGAIAGAAMEKWRRKRKNMQIVGVSQATLNVLCMPIEGGRVIPTVVSFGNVDTDEHANFEEYFQALITYQPGMLQMFQEQARGKS